MRYYIAGFVGLVVLAFAAFSYFMVLPIYNQKKGEFVPIEVDKETGFAKKTLKTSEIEEILDTELALTIQGDENSPLKVVVFYDYNCPYCMIEEATLNEALEGRNDIRVVLRPLPFMGEDSQVVAKMAMAAARLNVFPEFHEAVYSTHGKMTFDRVVEVIEKTDLPVDEIVALVKDASIDQNVQENFDLALRVGAHYVPTFVIGNRLYMPLDRDTRPEEFVEMFEQELIR